MCKFNNFIKNKIHSLINQYGYEELKKESQRLKKIDMINNHHYFYNLICMSKDITLQTLPSILDSEEVQQILKKVKAKELQAKKEKDLQTLKDKAFQEIRQCYKDDIRPYDIALKKKLLAKVDEGYTMTQLQDMYTKDITKYEQKALQPVKDRLMKNYPMFKELIPNWRIYL